MLVIVEEGGAQNAQPAYTSRPYLKKGKKHNKTKNPSGPDLTQANTVLTEGTMGVYGPS